MQFPVEIPVMPGEEIYDDIGKIKTYVYLPTTAPEPKVATDTKQYSSVFYRLKNQALKILKSILIDVGWVKLPKFSHFPDEVGKN